MKMAKRFLVSLLISCMVISMVPSSAFAQEGIPEGVENVSTPVESEIAPQEAAPVEEAAPVVEAPVQAAEVPAAVSAVPETVQETVPEAIPEQVEATPVEPAAPVAEETAPVAEEEQTSEVTDDTAAPAAEIPEVIPEENADETEAAEVTDASEDTADETEAPEATEAADENVDADDSTDADENEAAEETDAEDQQEAEEEEEETESEEEKFEVTQYVYDDNVIRVTAYLSNPADLSDKAQLFAQPAIPENGYSNAAYFAALNEGSDFVYDASNTYLYDIHFELDGAEVQPAGEVTVVAEFKFPVFTDFIHAQNSGDVTLIQMPRVGAAATAYSTTKQAAPYLQKTDIAKIGMGAGSYGVDINAGTLTFKTAAFSVFALVNSAVQPVVEEPAVEEPAAEEAAPEETDAEVEDTEDEFDAVSEDEEETEVETEEEEESSYPAVVLTQTIDSTTITVDAPEGAFPEGIQMSVVPADPESILIAVLEDIGYSAEEAPEVAEAIIESGADLSEYIQNYTLTFYLPENPGEEIEPEKEVEIKFENLAISTEEVAVYHDDGSSVDKLNSDVINEEVTASVPSFSDVAGADLRGIRALAAGARGNIEEDLSLTYNSVAEAATALYSDPNAETYNPQIYIEVTDANPEEDLAGKTRSYHVAYGWYNIPNWGQNMTKPLPIFHAYTNNTITITLPAGLLIPQNGIGSFAFTANPSDMNDPDPTVEHTYTINLEDQYGAGGLFFDFTVYVANNGQVDAEGNDLSVKDYNLPTDFVQMHTDFSVIDPQHNNAPVGNYHQDVSDIDDTKDFNFSTVTNDVWGVEKEAAGEPSITYDSAGKPTMVTFTWNIYVGLVDPSNPQKVLKGTGYNRFGVDAFELDQFNNPKVYIDDSIVTKLLDGTTSIDDNPAIGTVTIAKAGGTAQTATFPIQLKGDLAMNQAVSVLVDGLSDTRKVYTDTQYVLTVTYPVTDEMIADFSLNRAFSLDSNNTVDSSFKIVSQTNPQIDTANAHQNKILPIVKPSKLTIDKRLRNSSGLERDYDTQYGKNVYGDITYTLSAAEPFKVYELGTDGKYSEKYTATGSDGAYSVSGLSSDTVYYLPPEISYSVKEDLTPDQDGNMKFVSYSWGPTPTSTDYIPTQTSTTGPVSHEPKRDEAWTTQVINRETKGSVTVVKTDGSLPLGQVEFTLYTDPACQTKAQMYELEDGVLKPKDAVGKTADQSGKVTLGALAYGTYYMKETGGKAGYQLSDTQTVPEGVTWDSTNQVWTINISDTNQYVTVNVVNDNVRAKVQLKKFVGVAEAMPITNPATSSYGGTFELQRTTTSGINVEPDSSSTWTTVTADVDGGTVSNALKVVNNNGESIELTMPAKDESGNVYWYRFKETIPTGFYDAYTGSTTVSYSDPANLFDNNGNVKTNVTTVLEMSNRRMIETYVNKNFYPVKNNGQTNSNNSNFSTKVKLYYYLGDDKTTLQQYGTEEKTVKSGTYARWNNLKAFDYSQTDSNGNIVPRKIHYLVKESEVATFKLDESQTKNIVTIDNVRYIEITISTAGNADNTTRTDHQPYMSKTLYNVQQLIPVQIYKRNYYTNSPLGGSKITVYDSNGNVVYGRVGTPFDGDTTPSVTTTKLENIEIPFTAGGSTNYLYIYLEPGKNYTFKETTVPSGYRWHSYDVTVSGDTKTGSIDLTKSPYNSQTYANRTTLKNLSRNVYNYEDPLIKINKIDSITKEPVDGPVFTVYVRKNVGSDTLPVWQYETYPLGGTAMTIESNADAVEKLPPSDILQTLDGYSAYEGYFLAETGVPEGYLDPNESFDLYHEMDTDYIQGKVNNKDMTFLKVTVTNGERAASPSSQTPNTFNFTAKNIPNKANMIVLKYIDGALASVPGFPIIYTATGSDGTIYTNATNPGTTNASGAVTFTDLPVYDNAGNKLVYTITEDENLFSEDFKSRFYKVSDGQKAELSVGETIDVDNTSAHNKLIVHNATRIEVYAYKDKIDTWDYNFTHMQYSMAGATIGLFVKDDSDPNNIKWTLVPPAECGGKNPQETDPQGRVDFTGLRRDKDYALIELASGDSSYFPMIPGLGGQIKDDGYPNGGTGCTSITGDDLSAYNVRYLLSNDTSQSSSKIFDATKNNNHMINANHWLQFDVTKWLDFEDNRTPSLTDAQFGRNKTYDPHAEDSEFTTLDNCVFELYRYHVTDGTIPAFTQETGHNGWVFVDSYYTGSEYDENGHYLPGQFRTAVEQGVDSSYVYLIVEKSVGPNSGVHKNPNFVYTFWHAFGTNYTPPAVPPVSGASDGPIVVRDCTYKFDQVNYDDVLNDKYSGPGPGSPWYLASLRLSKWQDSFNETTGQPNRQYTPLANATFELRLPDGTVLSTLTVGLDDYAHGSQQTQAVAMAQGNTIRLIFEEDGSYSLYDYELEGYLARNVAVEETTVDGRRAWRILTELYETGTPQGYTYVTSGYPMYLYFVDLSQGGENWVFNDAYFVTDTDADAHVLAQNQNLNEPAWFVTTATHGAPATGIGSSQATLRIVNYPMQNTMVRVIKYGYKPNSNTVTLTSAQLDDLRGDALAAIDRKPLEGVQMVLKRQNDEDATKWDFWNYKSNSTGTEAEATFPTDGDGSFMFPKGLIQGTYMIYEISLNGDDHHPENEAYEMAYTGESMARIFTVGNALVNVTMYNPYKLSLTLNKQDMSDPAKPISGVRFKLGDLEGTTDTDGKVVFSLLESGTYKLEESGYPDAYTNYYLTHYLNTVYGLETIATTGSWIGYTLESNGSDVIVKTINPKATGVSVNGASMELVIKDPGVGKIQITKKNDAGKPITGNNNMRAMFLGYYRPFTAAAFGTSGETIDFTGVDLSTPANLVVNGHFEHQDSLDGFTVANTGVFTRTGLKPGIYAFYESQAPSGYDIPTTEDGKAIFYFLVVTGGMNVSVTTGYNPEDGTGMPESVTTKDGTNVVTYYEDTAAVEGSIAYDVVNHKKVNIYGKKLIENGEMPGGAPNEWEVRYDIYSDAACTTRVATLTLKNSTNQSASENIVFKAPGENTAYQFNPFTHYYLKETIVKPTLQFELETVERADTGTISPTSATSGIYDIFIDSNDYEEGITITVTNLYLWGRVLFSKVGEPNNIPLGGAKFEKVVSVTIDPDTHKEIETPVDGFLFTELLNTDGSATGWYQVDIPLVSAEKTTYRIYETEAPEPYVTDTSKYVEVELEFKEKEVTDPNTGTTTITYEGNYVDKRDDEPVTNTKGYDLLIVKYDNVYAARESANRVGKDKAEFTLFYSEDGENWSISDIVKTSGPDDEGEHSGEVYKLMTPGKYYAVLESNFSSDFMGKDGIYYSDGTPIPTTNTKTITVGETEYDVYWFGPVTGNITLSAYNKPSMKPVIIKRDAGGYPQEIIPGASFSIYKVDAEFLADLAALQATNKELADKKVEEFLHPTGDGATPPKAIFDGTTNHEGLGDTDFFTRAFWESDDVSKCWDYEQNYLLVETLVAKEGGTGSYDTLNKDDRRVIWYVPVPAQETVTKVPTLELDNVYGDATVTLKKTSDTTSVDSLLKSGCDVVYTLEPTVTSHNQPLSSFVLADSGLTFVQPDAGSNYDGPNPSYSITKVLVGAASHNPANLGITGTTEIKAKVTFKMADGSTESATPVTVFSGDAPVSVLADPVEVNAPAGKKPVSFTIEYYSTEVNEGTHEVYDLGQDFNVGQTFVYVTVDKLSDGTMAKPVAPVNQFTNKADVELHYPKWAEDGSKTTDIKSDDSKTVDTTVGDIKLPTIAVEKESNPAQNISYSTPNNTVYIQYILTLKNTSTTEVLPNPMALDILPTGISYVNDAEHPTNVVRESTVEPAFDWGAENVPGKARKIPVSDVPEEDWVYGDAENAVVFKLSGQNGQVGYLQPGETVTISFWGKVAQNLQSYGTNVANDVYMSSSAHSYHTVKNPIGYPFETAPGQYAQSLPDAAQTNETNSDGRDNATVREDCMHDALGDYAANNNLGIDINGDGKPDPLFTWTPAFKIVTVNGGGGIKVRKAVKGDQDKGVFHEEDEFLGTATRTNPDRDQEGWVDWRLSIYNGLGSDMHRITVGDVVPMPDDSRLTIWHAVMDEILGVHVNDDATLLTEGSYTEYPAIVNPVPADTNPNNYYYLYYYVGDINGAQAEVNSQLVPSRSWPESLNTNPAENWYAHGYLPSDKKMDDVTAFMIVVHGQVVLHQDKSMIVTYHTLTETFKNEQDQYFDQHIAFENANNTFVMHCEEIAKPVPSNLVSVTLMDGNVSVEGDLWIDEDLDGKQESRNRRDYYAYDIIKKLVSAMEFSITDMRNQTAGEEDQGTDWPTRITGYDYGWGESIKHFVFKNLGAAKVLDADLLYKKDDNDDTYWLNAKGGGLKTDNPYNYVVNSSIAIDDTGSGLSSDMWNMFRHSQNISEFWYSDDPDVLTATDTHVLDDNFEFSSGSTYKTRPFYLIYSENVDKTKDIGVQLFRGLELTKVAEGTTTALPGAEFQIYGPFEDTELGFDPKTPVPGSSADVPLKFSKITVVDDEDTGASHDVYVLDPAGAEDTLVTDENGKLYVSGLNWWKEYEIKETNAAYGYTVEGTTATPDTSVGTVIEDLGNGSFMLKVPATNKLVPNDKVTVENPPSETSKTPKATKTISGEPLGKGVEKEFTFTLTLDSQKDGEGNDITDAAYVTDAATGTKTYLSVGDGTEDNPAYSKSVTILVKEGEVVPEIVFDEITYVKPGIYTYTVKEITESDDHFTCDTTEWIYKVIVTRSVKGELIAEDTYQKKSGGQAQTDPANFDNKYTPIPIEWIPQAKKLMSEDSEPIPEPKTFEFKLTASESNPDGATLPKTTQIEVTVPQGETKSPIGKFADPEDPDDPGSVLHGIKFEKAGTYTFQVDEIPGNDSHIGYTSAHVTFTVTVEDINGVLTIKDDGITTEGTVDQEGTVVTALFTNTYTVEPTEWQPKVQKLMTGAAIPEAKSFTFKLSAASGNPSGATLPVGKQVTVTVPKNRTVSEVETFDPISFAKAGTYTFLIEEVIPQNLLPGVTYATGKAVLTVTIKDNKGKLEVESVETAVDPTTDTTVSFDTDSTNSTIVTAKFTNTYNVNPVDFTPHVYKEMTMLYGPTKEDKVFSFTITPGTNNPAGGATFDTEKHTYYGPGGSTEQLDSNVAKLYIPAGSTVGKTAEFGKITFSIEGTYTFTIKEDVPNPNPNGGITYDATEWTLTVEVEDVDGQMTIKGTPQYTADGKPSSTQARFSNVYKPTPTNYIPEVSKILTQSKGETKEPKIFTFTLTEGSSNPAGATYAQHTWTDQNGVVQPLDAKTAKLFIPAGSGNEVTAQFGEITFVRAGEYYFTIKEQSETGAPIGYDPTEWTLKVVVEDNNGTLSVAQPSGHMYNADGKTPRENNAHFTNTYEPEPTELTIPVTKTLTGNNPPEEVTFTFTLTGIKNADNVMPPMPSGDGNVATVTMTTAGTTKTTNFGKIEYDADGTYEYNVKETVGTVPGMKWDLAEYKVTVTVTNVNDKLSARYAIVKVKDSINGEDIEDPETAEIIEFINDYTPEPVNANLQAKKLLDGEPLFDPEGTVFTFTMRSMNGEDATGFVMPAETDRQITITGEELEAATGRTVTKAFADITFTKPGTYKFEITEEAGDNGRIYYDPTRWVATVVVRDAKNGKLVIDDPDGITYTPRTSDGAHFVNNEAAVFTNNYNPDDTQFTPKVQKIMDLVEGEPIVKDKYFHFTLKADPANPEGASFTSTDAPMTAEIHVSPATGTGGTEFFNMITFSKADTYTFIAEEIVEAENGVTYTREKGTMTLKVENIDDAMKITEVTTTGDVIVEPEDPDDIPVTPDTEILVTARFTNTYMPKPVSWKMFAKKYMSEDSEPTVVDKDFTFKLTATDVVKNGVYLSKDPYQTAIKNDDNWSKTVTVPAGSTFSPVKAFDEFTFIRSGKYVFTVTEVIPNTPLPGITYTTDPVVVTVTIDDINEELKVVDIKVNGTAEFDEEDDLYVNATFTNEYDVVPVPYTPPVIKDLTVDFGPTVVDKVFNFTLDLKSAKSGDRDVTDGCTHYKQEDEAKRSATNPPYEPFIHDDAQVKVEAGEVTNKTEFQEIYFTKAGTYVFEIKETAEDLAGIIYDTKVWTLTVVVEDTDNVLKETHTYSYVDEDGKTVTVEDIIEEGEDGEEIFVPASVTFDNEYVPEPVDWTPKAKKLMDGDEVIVKDKTFSFNLDLKSQVDAAGDPMTEGTTWTETDTKTVTVHAGDTESDVVDFDNMTFSKAGTYVFEITETENTNDDEPAMSYDDETITLTVEIEDQDGWLKVVKVTADPEDKVEIEPVIDEEDEENILTYIATAKFTNSYNPVVWAPKVLKKLTGRDWLPHEGFEDMNDTFTFTLTPNDSSLVDEDGNEILSPMPVDKGVDVESVTVTIDKESNFEADFADVYGPIFFEKVGKYSYTVTEIIPEDAKDGVYEGITYAEPVTITFELTEDEETGKLVPVDAEDMVETVEMENIYEAEGKIRLEASKHFAEGNMTTSTYDFEVYEAVAEAGEGEEAAWTIAADTDPIAIGTTGTANAEDSEVTFQYIDKEGNYTLDDLIYTHEDLIEKQAADTAAEEPEVEAPEAEAEDEITYLDSKVFDYIIIEVIPDDATAIFQDEDGLKRVAYKDATDEQKKTGRFVKDNVVYDGSEKHVQVLVEDNKKNGELEVSIVKDDKYDVRFENTWDKARLRLTKTIMEYVDGESVNAVFNFLITGDGTWTDGTPFEPVSKSVRYNAASNNAQYVDIELPYDISNIVVTEVYSGNYEAEGGPTKTVVGPPVFGEDGVPVYTVNYTNYLNRHDRTKGIVNVYSNTGHPDVTEEGTGFVITERIGAND